MFQNSGSYNPKKMNESHKEILRLLMLGEKKSVIAREVNVSLPVVDYVAKSDIGKQYLENMSAAKDIEAINVSDKISELSKIAIQKLGETLVNEDANISHRDKVAMDILDRAGFSPTRKISVDDNRLKKNDIDEIKRRGLEIMRSSGLLAEAEVEEVNDESES